MRFPFPLHSFLFCDSTLAQASIHGNAIRGIRNASVSMIHFSFSSSSSFSFRMYVSLNMFRIRFDDSNVVMCTRAILFSSFTPFFRRFSFGFFFVIDSSTWYYVLLLFAYK